jgi:4-cresol dehydrogenase (hydroxylating)
MLDLKKMNKILHVDPELCTALVEPGVTYQQLYDYIQEQTAVDAVVLCTVGYRRTTGQHHGSWRGLHTLWRTLLMQCGMEVVLANGDVYRTGMGG